MDRFIALLWLLVEILWLNLKSNMDRFIAQPTNDARQPIPHLKSNMDRFIDCLYLEVIAAYII